LGLGAGVLEEDREPSANWAARIMTGLGWLLEQAGRRSVERMRMGR
jgi:hypothetical protein